MCEVGECFPRAGPQARRAPGRGNAPAADPENRIGGKSQSLVAL
jgi:hypothetical protein